MAAFYAEEYRLLYEGSAEPTSRNLSDQRGRAESLYSFSRSSITTIKQHLDIGCSVGLLLHRFQDRYHCRPVGIEPNDAHRAHAQKDGLPVYATMGELENHEKDRFDLISMVHVLEHLPDPVGYLVHLRESLLAPDGWLLLEVPNLYAHDSFEIAHLVSYSPHTLRQVLEKYGVRGYEFRAARSSASKISPLYISMLARPASASQPAFILQPEKLVAFKRQSGMLRRRILERLFPRQAWTPTSN